MDSYTITVFFANHGGSDPDAPPVPFPTQTVEEDQLQIIRISEENPLFPLQNSLQAASQATGKYTVFLDEGDKFPKNFLERLSEALETSEASFAMPAMLHRSIHWEIEPFTMGNKEDYMIDTSDEVPLFPPGLGGLMIRTNALLAVLPECIDKVEPEKQVLMRLLQRNPVFPLIGSQRMKYRQTRECNYQYDLRCFDHNWYYKPLTDFLLPLLAADKAKNGEASSFHQQYALYMLHCRTNPNVNNRNKRVIPPEDVPAYMDLFSDILEYVSTDTILSRTLRTTRPSLNTRLFMLHLKKRDFSYYPDLVCQEDGLKLISDGAEFGTLISIPVRINLIDYKAGCLEIDGALYDFFSLEQAEVFACLDDKRFPLTYNKRYSMTKCFGVTYSRMKTFHVSVPVPAPDKERVLYFLLCTGGKEFRMDITFPAHTSRFQKTFPYAYWKFGQCLSYYKKDGIHIVRSTKLKVLYKELRFWQNLYSRKHGEHRKQLALEMLNFILRPYFSRQRIWLFFDKIYKGGDSSEYMYKYACAQKDGIKKYYLLDEKAADYQRLRREGYRPLKRNSLKHRLIFLNANMVIASNSTVFAFNDYNFYRSLAIRGVVHFDVACVQHGMSIQKIALAQQRLRDNTKLYFCASKYEIENLSKPVYDYVGYDALKLTGVPRYDGLIDRHERIILISPTWRMNSARPVSKNEGVARDYNPNFRETNYFKVYNSLINDPRLLDAAKRYNYRIQYVLHPIVSPQLKDFTTNEFVEIIPAIGDMSYEKVFCESALMVTDFSGVQFDFAYMRKPVVYLHHNDIPQHYENGTFFYDTMGFGEICHTNDELIDVLCEYMKNDCVMPEMYRKRADDFFAFSDHKNCERIYPIMLEHERNREQ